MRSTSIGFNIVKASLTLSFSLSLSLQPLFRKFFIFDMEEAQEVQLSIKDQEAKRANSHGHTNHSNQQPSPQIRNLMFWIRVVIYAFLVLSCQTVATLLGRLYFDKGGKSKWMGTLVQLVGFPILLPYYFFSAKKYYTKTNLNTTIPTSNQSKPPSTLVLVSVYVVLGLIIAADCYLYSVGLLYLPVSTFSLICASQLAFNAFFSFFLNSQKFTFYIINSLVLVTVSSVLLVFEPESKNNSKVSKGKYAIGFICTVGASAGYGLVLSLTQFFMNRVLKKETFSVIMDVIFFQSLVASLATLVGFFASGEWASMKKEMSEFELGKVSYVMILSWIAISWQVFTIGVVGLILEVSSLFSNVVSALGLPIVPVLAVFFFHEKMDGIKGMALVLAVWGFISYAYQNYLDDHSSKKENYPIRNSDRASP